MTRRREKLVIAKNAVANIARGGAASLVALLLPPFLTRSMPQQAFGAWSIVLQLSAYVGYFDFGIQTALARFVAHSTERGDFAYRNRIVSTAFAMLVVSGGISFLGILAVAAFLPFIFHQLDGGLVAGVRVALLLVGGSLAFGLPSSVFASMFVGLQRNEIPATIIGLSRLTGAALVVVVVRGGGGLASMAIATATVNLFSFLIQYIAFRRMLPDLTIALAGVSRSVAHELFEYCVSLTIWGMGMLLVTGLDLTIVGAYRFQEVGYYAVAATLVTFLNGLFGALFGAMGSPAAVLHAREDRAGLGRMVSASTRLGMILLLAIGLPLILGTRQILSLWVGPTYAQHAALLVQILVAATIVRICVSPYIIAMIGTGEQRRIILVPILEGVVNLISSLIAGYYLGATGVALGTLIGAFVSLAGHLFYNMHRNVAIQLTASEYLRDSLARPLLCSAPVLALAALWRPLFSLLPFGVPVFSLTATGFLTLALVWGFGLMPAERRKLMVHVRSKVRSVF
jgi:O-antigen/teichoic acid export membrane protein